MAKRNDIPKVYLVSFPNGKRYVGITCAKMEIRKSEHYSRSSHGSSFAIHNALMKYGGQEKWEIVATTSSFEEAKELEIQYIKELNTIAPNGYNLTKGGDGIQGHKMTLEQKKRLSNAHKGYIMPESQKKKIAISNTGKKGTTNVAVEAYDKNTGLLVGRFESLTECANVLGVKVASVWQNLRGKIKFFSNYTVKEVN